VTKKGSQRGRRRSEVEVDKRKGKHVKHRRVGKKI